MLLVCVDRLMGQTHELADGWRRTSPVGLPHMSSVSVQGLAVIGWIAYNSKEPCPCPLADAAVATITSTPYYRPRAYLP